MRHRVTVWAACAGLVGCVLGRPPVVPFQGVAPSRVLVVPTVVGGDRGDLARLDRAFAAAIADRGYEVVAGPMAAETLVPYGWDRDVGGIHEVPVERLAADHAIDAIWITYVDGWQRRDEPGRPLTFDVRVSVVATRDAAVIWLQDLEGSQPTVVTEKAVDPFAERSVFEAHDPAPWRTRVVPLSPEDVAGAVANAIVVRLPRRR